MRGGLWVSWYEGDRNTWKMIIETVAAEEHRTRCIVRSITRNTRVRWGRRDKC